MVSFLNSITNDNSPIKLCQFGFKTDVPEESDGHWRPATTKDYIRASFLPTVCIDTNFYNEGDLKDLIGCNYIHLAIINQMVTNISQINVYECIVGSQTENQTLTFSLENTFIKGYMSALCHNKLLSLKQIKTITYYRLRGYLGLIIKNAFFQEKKHQEKFCIYSLITTIIQKLGLGKLFLLFPRIFIIYIFIRH